MHPQFSKVQSLRLKAFKHLKRQFKARLFNVDRSLGSLFEFPGLSIVCLESMLEYVTSPTISLQGFR